jgi:hypothetical protein
MRRSQHSVGRAPSWGHWGRRQHLLRGPAWSAGRWQMLEKFKQKEQKVEKLQQEIKRIKACPPLSPYSPASLHPSPVSRIPSSASTPACARACALTGWTSKPVMPSLLRSWCTRAADACRQRGGSAMRCVAGIWSGRGAHGRVLSGGCSNACGRACCRRRSRSAMG